MKSNLSVAMIKGKSIARLAYHSTPRHQSFLSQVMSQLVTYRNHGNMRTSKSLACVAGGIVVPGFLSWHQSREGFDLLPTFTRLQSQKKLHHQHTNPASYAGLQYHD